MKNYTQDKLQNQVGNTLTKLMKDSKSQRMNQTTPRGYLNLPVRASDPPVTKSGEMGLYYNSSSGKVRKSFNGSSWTDTTI